MNSVLRFLRGFLPNRDVESPPAPDAERLPLEPVATNPEELDQLLEAGNQQEDTGDWDAAEATYRRAHQRFPQSARPLVNIGNVHALRGQTDAARASFERAIALDPSYASAHLNLGNAQLALRRPRDAETAYRGALRVRPDWSHAWVALGCALEAQDRSDDAAGAYRQALQLDPGAAGAALNLSKLLSQAGDGEQAYGVLEDALRRQPNDAPLELELAQLDREHLHPERAVERYRRVLQRSPGDYAAWSSLLFTLNFLPEASAAQILEEHRRFGAARRVATAVSRPVPSQPGRRLRVGFVSADFRRHPVACFIEPLLRWLDRERVENYCYYCHQDRDDVTARLAGLADVWRDVAELSDVDLSALIETDGIDILVDLAGHTNGNRLGVFARKPAPVQVTWLGYLATTGLASVDYRLCDRFTDPEGVAEAWQVERPLRLPDSQWCYQPPVEVPAQSELPFDRNGFWTFGSFNQPAKLNESVLAVWAQVLAAIPGSRLELLGIKDRRLVRQMIEFFRAQGIADERLSIVGRLPVADYLRAFSGVDVALDTFPYNGGTTTCDALSMGVPVVGVVGDRSVARGGLSLLHAVGLSDWLAPGPAEVPTLVARQLAQPSHLAALRRDLPDRMRQSPLMDAPRFARNFEAALRQAWTQACVSRSPAS